jgi:hypothetical protein
MKLPSYFKDFLAEIEPSPSYKEDQASGHKTLRRRLANDEEFKKLHVNTFLQGSYKRNTAIHPGKDVDIVVVTTIDPDKTTPSAANKILADCLGRYYDNVEPQSRSFAVKLSYVTMDVVLATSRYIKKSESQSASYLETLRKADSLDADSWSDNELQIPDRDVDSWVQTHPKRQLAWTTDLNSKCGGYFVPLVKMFKWWRKETYADPKYPKGYTLERFAGECVDTSKRDHAEGFVALLETMVTKYAGHLLASHVPILPDPGIPANNVAHRLKFADFKTFMAKVSAAATKARAALDEEDLKKSADAWREIFGTKFPAAPEVKKASFPPTPIRPNKPAGFA